MMAMMIILIDLSALFGAAWWVYTKQQPSIKSYYWPALSFKLLAGAAVGWLYFDYYGQGDTIYYWQDGTILAERVFSDPAGALNLYWEDTAVQGIAGVLNDRPRSLFFVKIVSILSLVTGGNYWMMSGIMSFLSFLGAWYLFQKTSQYLLSSTGAAAIAFLFYPSAVFWSSGIIKESLGLAALFFVTGIFLTIIVNKRISWVEWIVALLSLWIGWNLKYYWMGVLLPVAVTTTIVYYLKRKYPKIMRFEFFAWVGLFAIFLLGATSIHPNFYPHRFLEVIVQNNQEFMNVSSPGNVVHYHELEATVPSVLLNLPVAFVAGFFRPSIGEAHNSLSLLAGFENTMLLVLLLSALPWVVGFLKAPHRLLGFATIIYCILLATFLALSTPNLGTLSRYKVGFLPFLVLLVIYQNPTIARLRKTNRPLGQ